VAATGRDAETRDGSAAVAVEAPATWAGGLRLGADGPVRGERGAGQNQPEQPAMRMASTRLRAPVFAIARDR
jgi:hypothetical protein